MKLLLIDNGSTFLQDLQWVLHDHSVVTVPYSLVTPGDAHDFDAIMLSGGHGPSVAHDHGVYKSEIELIRASTKPLLGICLGFELLCAAYEEKLVRLHEKAAGERPLSITHYDPLLADLPPSVFESHHWAVPHVHTLQELARSPAGVEAVKHPHKMQYGVQFHPEKDDPVVIRNFLAIAAKHVSS